MHPLRIALAQIAPRLGLVEPNLERHLALLAEAREAGAGLVVFPELGLTGYQLQDLAAEVAMRLDDPRLARLAAATAGLCAIVSFVEESDDHRLFIAAALLEDGMLRHVHRKVHLPTYGLFDERRFFAPGDAIRATPSRLGVGVGIAVCEDFWHLATPQLLALDGAQVLVNVSSSPGRDLAATNEVGLGTAASWRTLMRAYAQLTTSFVVFCNRVGVEESISFWGGSEVIGPTGAVAFSAPLYDEGLFLADVDLGEVRRERIALPLLRDERPELVAREWRRLIAGRAGIEERVAAGEPARVGRAGSRRPGSRRPGSRRLGPPAGPARRPASRRPGARGAGVSDEPLFVLPPELAIDTAVARRVIAEFIRGQLAQAGFERAVLGLSGGIDSALVASLVAEAIGAERLLCVLMPYRTSSPASEADAREVVARLGCASELVQITPMVDGFFGRDGEPAAAGPEGLEASALRRGNFMARMRMAVLYDRSVTWRGLVVGTGNKTEGLIGYTTLFGDSASAFNPIGDLYKSQVRQVAAAIGVPEAIIRKAPSADLWPGQTDEAEAGFTYHELDRLLFWRIDKRRSVDELVALGFDRATVERVDRMVAGSEFKRQVPPIAKLGPRTAGVDYLYPRRRPGSTAG